MTEQLTVASGRHTYPIVIAAELRHQVGRWLQQLGIKTTDEVFLITDTNVAGFRYVEDVVTSIERAGFSIHTAIVPAGDASKSLPTAERMYNELLDAGVRRSGVLLALGGGVVGDLTGFIAATYQRGIRFIQLPTTLLAHDSSVGGKVGVNLPRGKNLVGAFYPPLAVLYDTEVLQTLPAAEWQAGMAEVIKHAVIGDQRLFEQLEQQPLQTVPSAAVLAPLLRQAISVKQAVVEADEHEQDLRMVLNVGHTVGHAIEQYSNYQLSHGKCVAIGMVVEGQIAVNRHLLSHEDFTRITRVLAAHSLPVVPPPYPFAKLAEIMNLDKKHGAQDSWTFALPEAIGGVRIYKNVTRSETHQAYNHLLKGTSS